MYSIEKTSYGLKIAQSGIFTIEEVERYKADVISVLSRHDGPFSILIDSRHLTLPTPEVLEGFDQLHDAIWRMKCQTVVIVVASPVSKGMVVQSCANSQFPTNDRIIDARVTPNWEELAVAWIVDGVEASPREPSRHHFR